MTLVKNDIPILEYDTNPVSIVDAPCERTLPGLCIMTFFREVLDDFVKKYNARHSGTYVSEMRPFEIYTAVVDGTEICIAPGLVGAPSAAMIAEYLFSHGVDTLIVCGSCGALEPIPAGDVIIPIKALRDEGTSYKYLPPARFIELDEGPRNALKQALDVRKVGYIETATWTTDAFCRETAEMVEHRRSEGCAVVDMECSVFAAVAKYRSKRFGQLLYSGDVLSDADNYDDRNWYSNTSARERLFELALDGLLRLK